MTIHHSVEPNPDVSLPDPHQDIYSKVYLGFWIYLMTDCVLFGTLFSTYAVMRHSTFGGPGAKELFELSTAFIETMILLVSSVTCGLAVLASLKNKTKSVQTWLAVTFILGAAFLALELHEFNSFVERGASWQRSGFLSAFFTLVGTHGLHITAGLIWIGVMLGQLFVFGINTDTFRRLVLFSLFWHFLDLVWIFIYTFVYLMGVA